MSLEKRINAFAELGEFLGQFKNSEKSETFVSLNDKFYTDFEELIIRQKAFNGWFDKENVLSAIQSVASSLSKDKLIDWLKNYEINNGSKRIGVIMAGNIPLVGFHDFLCVLITGNILIAKLSSDDNSLIRKVAEILIYLNPDFENKIYFVEKLENFDGVIATGSNNTSRYFEAYFGKYPHIIRKNRNSVAIINQNDSKEELGGVGKDIFQYYGLGCRNVSKIFFPKGYMIDTFFEAIYADYQNVTSNNKYANNYDYNKAVYLMGNNQLLDNGFLLLKEDKQFSSPVGVINYEFYDSIQNLENQLKEQEQDIQCVVSSNNTPLETVSFGEAQTPELSDYADGVDTVGFLLSL
jgi:Acyl-CoA reductase (LuxC)